jgi:hypothetical protein
MTRDGHQRAKEHFLEACERPVADRPGSLDRSCADDADLRELVVRMLAVDEQTPDFLAPPIARTADGIRAGELLDGKYAVIERIGEGGLGEVWRAHQGQPVQRDVAVKVVKPGLDTRRVVARFEAERQTLAILDHPNIAKVLDAGSTPQGRPYFVMELIDGRPITDHVEALGLDLRARLELFLTVCSAAQHAHQKGIIHRDIKPSNGWRAAPWSARPRDDPRRPAVHLRARRGLYFPRLAWLVLDPTVGCTGDRLALDCLRFLEGVSSEYRSAAERGVSIRNTEPEAVLFLGSRDEKDWRSVRLSL